VEQAGYRCRPYQLVVECHGRAGLGDVYRNAFLLKEFQGTGVDLKDKIHAPGEDDRRRAVGDQLFDVLGLDTGLMPSAGLVPVPGTAAAGIELEVLPHSQPLDVHSSPGDVHDPR